MKRRNFLGITTAALMAEMVWTPALAANGPVRILVGFAPGGSVDAQARMAAEVLTGSLGRPVVVENKPGAGGRIVVEQVKSAAPDGSTLLVCPQGPMTLFPHVFTSLRYDPARDFTPIARIGVSDMAFSVGPMVPARDLVGIREWLKAAGDRAAFGSPGNGTIPHFAGVAVAQRLGITMTHVPYQGSPKSLLDLAGGNIASVVSPLTDVLELHKSGKVRIIATLGASRSTFVPDIPTLRELGQDLEVQAWTACYGPAGMSTALRDRLQAAMAKGLSTPEAQQRMVALGLAPGLAGPAELEQLRAKETALWGDIVRKSGFKPNQ
jgi:tripartite-type tricarboxylate transporter receptor subunit TctC